MDIVYADGQLLYAPEDRYHMAFDMQLDRKANKSGGFEFTLYPGHPLYEPLRKMKSEVTIYRNGEWLWTGRVVSSKRDIYLGRKFYCEGELGYLNDSSKAPFKFTGTPAQYLYRLLENHNAQVYTDDHKQFKLGNVTVFGTLEIEQKEPDSVWNLISANLIEALGGFLVIRHESDGKYLDYLSSYEIPCSQRIELGVNLLDIEESIDASNIYTVLVPLGKSKDEDEYIGIESVNDGANYIQNSAAVLYYGRIVRTIIFDDLEKPADVLEAGKAELEKTLAIATTITVDAVDLTETGINTDKLDVGSSIRVFSDPHGLDTNFFCNAISETIGEPGSAKYTLGASSVSLTAALIAKGQRVTR